jgi:hypothetical protein
MAESESKRSKWQGPLIQTHRPLQQARRAKAERSHKSAFKLWPAMRLCLRTVLAAFICAGWTAAASAAPNHSAAQIDKFALRAYCAEAQQKLRLLADGQLSYKGVAELASDRALMDHPGVYKNSAAWKTRMVAVLDQYGDEPTTQLCREGLRPQHP